MSRPALLSLTLSLPLAAAASLTAPEAHADERVCRGSIGASSIDGNDPAPVGGRNTVQGDKENQCADL
jgi:hypothetical protein